jgi:hypothetical protein
VTVCATGKVAVGATLAIVTGCVAVFPAPAPKPESVAWAETVELAGPSGKVHWKEPLVLPKESESRTFVPFAPQLVETEAIVSPSSSLID